LVCKLSDVWNGYSVFYSGCYLDRGKDAAEHKMIYLNIMKLFPAVLQAIIIMMVCSVSESHWVKAGLGIVAAVGFASSFYIGEMEDETEE
jgi:hypothetical protein